MRAATVDTRPAERRGKKAASACGHDWESHLPGAEQEATAHSEAHVAALRREGLNLEADEQACLEGLPLTPSTSASALKVNLIGTVVWLTTAALLVLAGYELALHSLSLLGGHDAGVLAAVLAGGSAVAFELCLCQLRKVVSSRGFRIMLLGISVAPVLCLLSAALVMSVARAEHSALKEALALQDNAGVVIEGAEPQAPPQRADQSIQDYQARTRFLTMLLMILAAVGLEVTAALALHQATARLRPSLVLLAEQRRLRTIRRQLASCAFEKRRWEQYPRLVREAFTRAARLELGWQRKRRLIALIAGAVFLAVFLLSALTSAAADELVIVAIDLSTSSAGSELRDNTAAIERVIAQVRPGARIVIIPIAEHSFSSRIILDARLSTNTGLFDERLKAGRRTLARAWGERSKPLQGNAKATDIFGALLKAAVLREEHPSWPVALVLLSDMRQYDHRGYDFERHTTFDASLLARVQREGLIPSLPGVQVWVLGAHASGISDARWLALRRFWTEVLTRSGATLKAFSSERRWNPDTVLPAAERR